MRFSLSPSAAMASVSARRSSQLSGVSRVSLIWSITAMLSPESAYTGSERDTGSEIASRAKTTSSLFAPMALAISSGVGVRPLSAVSRSRACSAL